MLYAHLNPPHHQPLQTWMKRLPWSLTKLDTQSESIQVCARKKPWWEKYRANILRHPVTVGRKRARTVQERKGKLKLQKRGKKLKRKCVKNPHGHCRKLDIEGRFVFTEYKLISSPLRISKNTAQVVALFFGGVNAKEAPVPTRLPRLRQRIKIQLQSLKRNLLTIYKRK